MARRYAVNDTNQTLTGAKTIIQLKAGTNTSLRLCRASITQVGQTSSAPYACEIVRKSVAATVTSFTPILLSPNDAAAKAVGGIAATGVNASAEGTDGDIIWQDGSNVLGQWLWVPGREIDDIWVDGAGIIALKVVSGTLTNGYATLIFEECS